MQLAIQRLDQTIFGVTGTNGLVGTLREVRDHQKVQDKEIEELERLSPQFEMLLKSVDRLTNAVYTVGGLVIISAIGYFLTGGPT